MKRKGLLTGISVILVLVMLPAALSAASFADSAFESVWQRTDKPIADGRVARSWMWGPEPFTEAIYEPYAESPGGTRLVQYFDKSRMEINDPNADRSSAWFVTNGLLVREMVDGRVQIGDAAFEDRSPAKEAVAGDPAVNNPKCPTYRSFTLFTWTPADNRMGQKVTATMERMDVGEGEAVIVEDDPSKANYAGTEIAYYEEATGHNVPKALWDFMNASGLIYVNGSYRTGKVVDWLFAMGYPISEPYWARCTVGGEEKDVLVQLFERRVLTYTPSNPSGWQVEMGNVGQHYYTWRYGPAGPPVEPPTPPPGGTPGCPATPPDVDASISPKCGPVETTFTVEIWGFGPSEQIGTWINDAQGVPIEGTRETVQVRPDGTDTWIIRPWLPPPLPPGLYFAVYEGVTTGHQSIAYFTILGEAAPPPSCAEVPADINGAITPKCGGWTTNFCMDAWGFTPNEQVGFWLDGQHGIIGGTYTTVNIGPTGSIDDFCFEPREEWIGIDHPGLYWWVFEGTSSGHQSVLYWLLED